MGDRTIVSCPPYRARVRRQGFTVKTTSVESNRSQDYSKTMVPVSQIPTRRIRTWCSLRVRSQETSAIPVWNAFLAPLGFTRPKARSSLPRRPGFVFQKE